MLERERWTFFVLTPIAPSEPLLQILRTVNIALHATLLDLSRFFLSIFGVRHVSCTSVETFERLETVQSNLVKMSFESLAHKLPMLHRPQL